MYSTRVFSLPKSNWCSHYVRANVIIWVKSRKLEKTFLCCSFPLCPGAKTLGKEPTRPDCVLSPPTQTFREQIGNWPLGCAPNNLKGGGKYPTRTQAAQSKLNTSSTLGELVSRLPVGCWVTCTSDGEKIRKGIHVYPFTQQNTYQITEKLAYL